MGWGGVAAWPKVSIVLFEDDPTPTTPGAVHHARALQVIPAGCFAIMMFSNRVQWLSRMPPCATPLTLRLTATSGSRPRCEVACASKRGWPEVSSHQPPHPPSFPHCTALTLVV